MHVMATHLLRYMTSSRHAEVSKGSDSFQPSQGVWSLQKAHRSEKHNGYVKQKQCTNSIFSVGPPGLVYHQRLRPLQQLGVIKRRSVPPSTPPARREGSIASLFKSVCYRRHNFDTQTPRCLSAMQLCSLLRCGLPVPQLVQVHQKCVEEALRITMAGPSTRNEQKQGPVRSCQPVEETDASKQQQHIE